VLQQHQHAASGEQRRADPEFPFAFLELRPEGTKAKLRQIQDWFMSHARQLIAAIAIFAGAYMAISGLVRLVG